MSEICYRFGIRGPALVDKGGTCGMLAEAAGGPCETTYREVVGFNFLAIAVLMNDAELTTHLLNLHSESSSPLEPAIQGYSNPLDVRGSVVEDSLIWRRLSHRDSVACHSIIEYALIFGHAEIFWLLANRLTATVRQVYVPHLKELYFLSKSDPSLPERYRVLSSQLSQQRRDKDASNWFRSKANAFYLPSLFDLVVHYGRADILEVFVRTLGVEKGLIPNFDRLLHHPSTKEAFASIFESHDALKKRRIPELGLKFGGSKSSKSDNYDEDFEYYNSEPDHFVRAVLESTWYKEQLELGGTTGVDDAGGVAIVVST
ncbi:hypothetical protein BJ508DRAFT_333131 [Ascobolus immersus RN42]|uniref:Uncharacterized protein n=1 Tax=Ascobolus immersus RN42 TaxID=1160509 RepID=A0A3N4HM84_ASCIM|nr:hypothetical protein BJ508DRAFT_333131 [Ascobolus immersus RN42]